LNTVASDKSNSGTAFKNSLLQEETVIAKAIDKIPILFVNNFIFLSPLKL